MKKLLFLLLIAAANNSYATINILNGQTMTMGTQNVTEDIIVEGGGTLIITGILTFGNPLAPLDEYRISIEDGGSVYSANGAIQPLNGYKWYGIDVRPTAASNPNLAVALDLDNFAILRSTRGIVINVSSSNVYNQKITVKNSYFANNRETHVVTDILSGASYFNRDNSPNPVTFEYCDFMYTSEATSFLSPLWIKRIKGLEFFRCTFDNTGGQGNVGLHWSGCNDVLVSECTFSSVGEVGIVMHAESQNVDIVNNNFDPSDMPAVYYGIAIGCIINGGLAVNLNIEDNYFGSPDPSNDFVGVCNGNDNYDGQTTFLTIDDNRFQNFATGITSLKTVNASFIEENIFDVYEAAIEITGDNSSNYVRCNSFRQGNVAIKIVNDGTLYNGLLAASGVDANNKFEGSNTDIQNLNALFVYNYQNSDGNTHPADNILGYHSIFNASTIELCEPDIDEHKMGFIGEEEATIAATTPGLYPNPTSEYIFLTGLPQQPVSITVINALGQVEFSLFSSGNGADEQIDLSELKPGIYFLKAVEPTSSFNFNSRIIKR